MTRSTLSFKMAYINIFTSSELSKTGFFKYSKKSPLRISTRITDLMLHRCASEITEMVFRKHSMDKEENSERKEPVIVLKK